MTQIAIIVFREILEIAIILGILTVATKEIKGRFKWILSGILTGVIFSVILAIFTNRISDSINGTGQEIFNGSILLIASIMIGFTVLWMQKHAKAISGNLKNLSSQIKDGLKPLYALFFIVLFSVLRESAEIVLFCYGYFVSGVSFAEILVGLFVGLVCGSLVGIAFYLGLLKFSGKYFFKVTTILLVFLTASIAKQAFGFFVNAGIISAIKSPAFDISNILSQQSFVGKILHIFFGYVDRPTGLDLIVYFLALAILFTGLKLLNSKK